MVEKKTAMASALKAFIIIIWLIMATNANILTYEARADLAPIEASSGTEVGGIISSDTKWTLENSPYFLEDDVKVEDASLTIQPGVKVNLDFWSIIIGKDATLIARGTSSNRIEIFSEEELFGSAIYCMDGSIPWDESSKSGSIIEFVEFHLKLPDISFAIYSVSGIKISNNVFYEEGGEGIFVRSVNGIVCNNTIIGGRYGIRGRGNISFNIIKQASVAILLGSNNEPTNAFIFGNLLEENGMAFWLFYSATDYILNNTIKANGVGFGITNYAFRNEFGGEIMPKAIMFNNFLQNIENVRLFKEEPRITINMTYNWWGTTDTSLIDQKIYDQKDNRRLCLVNYIPFLNSSAISNYTKILSTISCSASPSTLTIGGSIVFSGSINPTVSDVNVILTYTRPDNSTLTRTCTTNSEGDYNDKYTPDMVGFWGVKASWEGNETRESANSQTVTFTVVELSPPKPAEFEISDLSITPVEVELDEEVTINVLVSNVGEESGSYTVTLSIASMLISIEDNVEVTFDGGESETISFFHMMDVEGAYDVEVDGLTGSFEVKAPPLKPAEFTVSDLTIMPVELGLGENVTVSVTIANVGEEPGNYTINLRMENGLIAIEDEAEVSLDGAASKMVSFTFTLDVEGTYNLEVDGLTGSLVVRAPPPKPAEFEVSNLTITPKELEAGGEVTISVLVTNVGEEPGNYTVKMSIWLGEPGVGYADDRGRVELEGGESQFVSFTYAMEDEGTYQVEVDGLTGTFEVVYKPSFWDKIPGFPYESIILGLAIGALVLWILKHKF